MIPLAFVAGYGIVEVAIAVVVVAAICALAFVALRQFGIQIPPWVANVFWICAVAVIVILAIKFVASLF